MDIVKQKLLAHDYVPARASEDEDDDSTSAWDEKTSSKQRARPFLSMRAAAYHAAFALCYVVGIPLLMASFWSKPQPGRPELIYTPARSHMKYKIAEPYKILPNHYLDDPFFGDPSPELDQRWERRLKHATIRLSEDEFRRHNQSGVLLGDNSGYLATPTVWHDLHCLRALHKSLYPDYYFAGEDISADPEHGNHWRHCLHNLASSAMCNADMTIRVMRWHPKLELPSPVDHEHECVDWDAIDAWAGERYVNTSIPGMMVHP